MNCLHDNFIAQVNVARLNEDGDASKEADGFAADIKIICASCGTPFHFRGVDSGYSKNRPMVSFDGLELRAPIRPGKIKLVPQTLAYELYENDLISSEENN